MLLLQILQYTLIALCALLMIYQLLLELLAFRGRKVDRSAEPVPKNRFAVIIPAHNEETIISRTIYSTYGMLYPKKLYDLIVVADNCTDNTARIARKLGAKVLERKNEKERGKGYALRWAFDRLIQSRNSYDAVVVLDADSLVSGNFLHVMNSYLERGSRVIQSSDLVLPEKGSWPVDMARISYLIHNHVKPLGRKVLGFQTGLRGNGMCFRSDVLREIPWQAWSLTEDLEYGLILMMNDIRIDFAPEATVWAEMPTQIRNAGSQRRRWEFGRFEIARAYAGRLLRVAFRKRSLKLFDVFVDLVTPPFVTFMLIILLMSLFSLLLWVSGIQPIRFTIIWTGLLAAGFLHLLLGLAAGRAEKDLYLAILRIPLYVVWKIGLYLSVIFKGRETRWVKTTRES